MIKNLFDDKCFFGGWGAAASVGTQRHQFTSVFEAKEAFAVGEFWVGKRVKIGVFIARIFHHVTDPGDIHVFIDTVERTNVAFPC